jgi:hypothetical protein
MGANVSNSQTLCWHCEEVVHRYATVCPYCRKSLAVAVNNEIATTPTDYLSRISQEALAAVALAPAVHNSAKAPPVSSKIAVMPAQHFQDHVKPSFQERATEAASSLEKEDNAPQIVEKKISFFPEVVQLLLPLISLLSGSFFFFFSILLKIFSKDGLLILEWDASVWPYYLFPSFLLLGLGISTFSRVKE